LRLEATGIQLEADVGSMGLVGRSLFSAPSDLRQVNLVVTDERIPETGEAQC
jgi:hypothetical protein